MKNKQLYKGVAIMLASSLTTCTGQLFWKLAAARNAHWLLLLGFGLYGFGALLMIFALRFGELSVLHPMLSAGYIISIILGNVVLHEQIAVTKVLGIAVITVGLLCLSVPERRSS